MLRHISGFSGHLSRYTPSALLGLTEQRGGYTQPRWELGAGSCPSLLGGASCDVHWHSWGTRTSPHCCVLMWPHPQWIFSWPVCSAVPGCGHLSRPQCPLADGRSSWGGPQAVTGPSWPGPCATGTLVGLGTFQSPFQKRFVTVTSEPLHCFDCVPGLVNSPTG